MSTGPRRQYSRARIGEPSPPPRVSARKHRFKLGQEVRFVRNTVDRVPRDMEESLFAAPFEITRLLPEDGAEFQYRLKNLSTGQERIAAEGELVSAAIEG